MLSLTQGRLAAQTAEADSMDVLHYFISLDMGYSVDKQVQGVAEITFVLTKNCNAVTFDLICDRVDPITLDGTVTRGYSYDHDNALLTVNLSGGHAGDTHVVSIPYMTNGYVEGYGWGGLHLDNTIYYNLGVAFMMHPHVFGRAWFPCRDNFYDKASYLLGVKTKAGWRALCSGLRQDEVFSSLGNSISVWSLEQPTPTYLVSVSAAPWHIIERQYESLYGTYPAIIGYMNRDSARVYDKFDVLEDVLPAFERAFGPYRWDRIGYIATPQGSMEHASNIGLVDACIADDGNACQMTTCHELAHAWFGNLVTCATEGDMWINEGGATFCEEVATEAMTNRASATQYYQDKLSEVLRTAHLKDNGYRALSGMSTYYTYGSTTYDKGALVWHSLRGMMGDSLFYSCMNRLFDRCAFGNIDAAGLRDSLSLYSGMDLGGFFDFHVFNPGFVDYNIAKWGINGNERRIEIHQHLKGTDQYAHGCPVPVTFVSNGFQEKYKVWLMVDDSVSIHHVTLPENFNSGICPIIDFDNELSDACTDNVVRFSNKGVYDLPNAYCKIYAREASEHTSWVHVGLHYTHPTGGDTLEGVVRMTDHYWKVVGQILSPNVEGRFLYNMGAQGISGAENLDAGFYESRYSLDSLCLMYRQDESDSWKMVSRKRTNSSSVSTGYFVSNLLPGEYTLAVVDTNIVGIEPVALSEECGEVPQLRLFPNPGHGQFKVEVEGYDKKFDLAVFDASGKKVLTSNGLFSGDTVHHNLPVGSYVVIIKNNFISLQSQIIVQ